MSSGRAVFVGALVVGLALLALVVLGTIALAFLGGSKDAGDDPDVGPAAAA